MSLNGCCVDASSKVASKLDTSCLVPIAMRTVPAFGEAAAQQPALRAVPSRWAQPPKLPGSRAEAQGPARAKRRR